MSKCGRRPIPKEKQDAIFDLRERGLSSREIALALGIDHTTAAKYLKLAGYPRLHRRKVLPDMSPDQRRLYRKIRRVLGRDVAIGEVLR